MSQIKPTQIIPSKVSSTSPNVAMPVDLDPNQRSLVIENKVSLGNLSIDPQTGNILDQNTSTGTESLLQQDDATPSTPAIITVKQQVVKIMPDGTSKIDVVLEVQDIPGAVEYDIRVAKSAGTV
jgi:hypothetical protein